MEADCALRTRQRNSPGLALAAIASIQIRISLYVSKIVKGCKDSSGSLLKSYQLLKVIFVH